MENKIIASDSNQPIKVEIKLIWGGGTGNLNLSGQTGGGCYIQISHTDSAFSVQGVHTLLTNTGTATGTSVPRELLSCAIVGPGDIPVVEFKTTPHKIEVAINFGASILLILCHKTVCH